MIRNFRLFTGRSALISSALWSAACVAFLAALVLISGGTENEALKDFCEGFIPTFAVVIPVISFAPSTATFTYNRPTTPGYKFLHSLPESGKRFSSAILAGSLISAAIVLIWGGVFCLWDLGAGLFLIFVGLTLKGTQNVFGHAKSVWAMFLPMLAVVFGVGFVMGFTSGDEDELALPEPKILLALAAAGLAVFAVGTIYSVSVAAKKWRREQ